MLRHVNACQLPIRMFSKELDDKAHNTKFTNDAMVPTSNSIRLKVLFGN